MKFTSISNIYLARRKYQLAQSLKRIIQDLRKGTIVIDSDKLVPKMLEIGNTRGTADFEKSVKDLLAMLARRIPSAEYRQDFEKYI